MKFKKLLAVAFAAILMFTAVACGSSGGNPADTEAVNAALDRFRSCTSFTASRIFRWQEAVTDGELTELFDGRSEMSFSIITGEQPRMRLSTLMQVENGGDMVEQSSTSYLVPENGSYSEYSTDGYRWSVFSYEDGSALSAMNASYFIATFFTDDIGFSKAGEDNLAGGKATRYDGTVSGEALVTLLEVNGQLSDVSSMSESQQANIKGNLAKDLDGLTLSVWIDEASGYPVYFQVSLTEILEDMNESISKSLGNKSENSQWSITEYVISMSVSDFNAVEEIVLPPEAASATPYAGS